MKATTVGANGASGSGVNAASSATISSTAAASTGQQTRSSRIAPHSHIRGLGLDSGSGLVAGAAGVAAGGFVGQDMAREVRFVL